MVIEDRNFSSLLCVLLNMQEPNRSALQQGRGGCRDRSDFFRTEQNKTCCTLDGTEDVFAPHVSNTGSGGKATPPHARPGLTSVMACQAGRPIPRDEHTWKVESKLCGCAAAARRRVTAVEILLLVLGEAADGDFCDGDGHHRIVVHRLHLGDREHDVLTARHLPENRVARRAGREPVLPPWDSNVRPSADRCSLDGDKVSGSAG